MSIYESPCILLTAAAILLVAASIVCQIRPGWKRWPYIVPLLIGALAFGLDLLVKTDAEQIRTILNDCRTSAVEGRIDQLGLCIADTYMDSLHRSKESLLNAAEGILQNACLERVLERGLNLQIEGDRAASRVRYRVHLNPQRSRYAVGGSLLFVSLEFEFFRQPNGRWLIQQILLESVNDHPMSWREI